MVYLDHAATTPVRPEAVAAWLAAPPGNASSQHATGRAARRCVEEARESIAADLGVAAGDVIFTAGGTSADNLAIQGIARARQARDPERRVVVVSAVEHHAVLDTAHSLVAEGFRVVTAPVTTDGRLDVTVFDQIVREQGHAIALVSVMTANNETGATQPLREVAELLAGSEIPLHTDAVQSVGWDGVPKLPGVAVACSLSGHKFGAPVGIGALVLPTAIPCQPVQYGGGQERRLHSGTLNTPGAAALAAALHASRTSHCASGTSGVAISDLRAELRSGLATHFPDPDDAVVVTPADHCLPGIVSVMFPGCEADALLMLLDAVGVECSAGSACSAGVPQPSAVLRAMGYDADAARAMLRFSLGWTSTRADVHALLAALPDVVQRARTAGARRRSATAVRPRSVRSGSPARAGSQP